MTEYSKVVAAVAALKDVLAGFDSNDALRAFDALRMARSTESNLTPRVVRLLLRAREKNPDRQLFNEVMCEKIEALAATYFDTIVPLFAAAAGELVDAALGEKRPLADPSTEVDAIEAAYADTLVAQENAAQHVKNLMLSIDGIVRGEEDGRLVWQRRESLEHAEVREGFIAGRALLRERELLEAKRLWEAEVERRSEETAKARAMSSSSLDEVKVCIDTISLNSRRALAMLLRELQREPDLLTIRRIRNNSEAAIRDFGHPALPSATTPYQACEAVLFAVGYLPQYTSHPTEVPRGGSPVGYEAYGERILELREPHPMENSDAWMVWYDRLGTIAEFLEASIRHVQ